jgi:hypothetical protein
MQTGQIVKIFDQGATVQILCADERGLLSAYCELKPYRSFIKKIKRAGLKLNGLLINFDSNEIRVPALRNNRGYSTHQ